MMPTTMMPAAANVALDVSPVSFASAEPSAERSGWELRCAPLASGSARSGRATPFAAVVAGGGGRTGGGMGGARFVSGGGRRGKDGAGHGGPRFDGWAPERMSASDLRCTADLNNIA